MVTRALHLIPTLGSKYYGILLLSNRSPHLANREWRLTAHGGEALITMGICVHFYCFKALRWGDVHYGILYTLTAFKVLGDATFTDGVLTYSEWWWCFVIMEWCRTSCWRNSLQSSNVSSISLDIPHFRWMLVNGVVKTELLNLVFFQNMKGTLNALIKKMKMGEHEH